MDSEVSSKFRFTHGAGARSARGCRRRQASEDTTEAILRWHMWVKRLPNWLHMLCRLYTGYLSTHVALDIGKTQLGQVHPRTTPTRQRAVGGN